MVQPPGKSHIVSALLTLLQSMLKANPEPGPVVQLALEVTRNRLPRSAAHLWGCILPLNCSAMQLSAINKAEQ